MNNERIVEELLKSIDEIGSEYVCDDVNNGLFVKIGKMEYNIFNESQRHMEATIYILETLEYFTPSFLSFQTGLDEELFEGISEYKRANAIVNALIKGTCGITEFVNEAIETDGYGHFLSPYDGKEIELDIADGWDSVKYYAYRVN